MNCPLVASPVHPSVREFERLHLNHAWSISAILFEVGIPNLVC